MNKSKFSFNKSEFFKTSKHFIKQPKFLKLLKQKEPIPVSGAIIVTQNR